MIYVNEYTNEKFSDVKACKESEAVYLKKKAEDEKIAQSKKEQEERDKSAAYDKLSEARTNYILAKNMSIKANEQRVNTYNEYMKLLNAYCSKYGPAHFKDEKSDEEDDVSALLRYFFH